MHYIMKETDPATGNRALLDGGSATTANLSRAVTPAPGMSESGHLYTPGRDDDERDRQTEPELTDSGPFRASNSFVSCISPNFGESKSKSKPTRLLYV